MKNSILIIGGGSIGQRHLRNLLFLRAGNISVVETNKGRANQIAGKYRVTVFASIEQALKSGSYNIAFICTPTAYHLDSALLCAGLGMHLFIEKPLANGLNGAKKLLGLAKSKGLVTMVGSNWKFYPLFRKMKQWIDGGEIGKIFSARCQAGQYLPDWHPKEDYRKNYSANKKLGGGILSDCHEFDYLTWFMGDAVKLSCFAKKASNLEIDVEDVAVAILEFKSGALGEIHVDYLQRFYQRNFEFFGQKGTIKWNFLDKKAILEKVGQKRREFLLPAGYDLNKMYIEEAKHFLQCVKIRRETLMPAAKAYKVLQLIAAARGSVKDGRAKKI